MTPVVVSTYHFDDKNPANGGLKNIDIHPIPNESGTDQIAITSCYNDSAKNEHTGDVIKALKTKLEEQGITQADNQRIYSKTIFNCPSSMSADQAVQIASDICSGFGGKSSADLQQEYHDKQTRQGNEREERIAQFLATQISNQFTQAGVAISPDKLTPELLASLDAIFSQGRRLE